MAKYASIGDQYNVRIAEQTGDKIHVWSASAEQSFYSYREITVTLNVFSRDLQLIAKKIFHLGQIFSWKIDFQYADSCYYANIITEDQGSYIMTFKVDFNGNCKYITDSSKLSLTAKPSAFNRFDKNYAITRDSSNFFAIIADNTVITDSAELNKISFLDKENPIAEKGFKKVILRKVKINGQDQLDKTYSFTNLDFSYPYINLNDSTISACAFAKKLRSKERNPPNNNSYIFITRLDNDFKEPSINTAIVPISNPAKGDDFYTVCGLFSLNNKLFVLSNGRTNNYVRHYIGGRIGNTLSSVNINLVNSLRVTVVDKKNQLLRDTIIGNGIRTAQLYWENCFINAVENKIDIFSSIQYRASRYGITHMSINSDGTLQENNIIVEDRFNYLLYAAKKMGAGELIVPYEKNGRVKGIMKLSYGQQDVSVQ